METVVIVLIVGAAGVFIARKAWRAVVASRAEKAGCGSCGCETTTSNLHTDF